MPDVLPLEVRPPDPDLAALCVCDHAVAAHGSIACVMCACPLSRDGARVAAGVPCTCTACRLGRKLEAK